MNENTGDFFLVLFLIMIPVIIAVLRLAIPVMIYYRSSYYRITNNSYFEMSRDTGRMGEYETYKALRIFEKKGARFLFNLYLPKGNEETTEIDVLMIARNGLFVFESKNYSGWIFGDEKQKMWTQTLPRGRGRSSNKERFLNPVWQNKLHISSLRQVLVDQDVDIFSIIVFSNRCELKNINLYHEDISIVHRRDIVSAVARCIGCSGLSDDDIACLFNLLFPYSQTTQEEKQKHIEQV